MQSLFPTMELGGDDIYSSYATIRDVKHWIMNLMRDVIARVPSNESDIKNMNRFTEVTATDLKRSHNQIVLPP